MHAIQAKDLNRIEKVHEISAANSPRGRELAAAIYKQATYPNSVHHTSDSLDNFHIVRTIIEKRYRSIYRCNFVFKLSYHTH